MHLSHFSEPLPELPVSFSVHIYLWICFHHSKWERWLSLWNGWYCQKLLPPKSILKQYNVSVSNSLSFLHLQPHFFQFLLPACKCSQVSFVQNFSIFMKKMFLKNFPNMIFTGFLHTMSSTYCPKFLKNAIYLLLSFFSSLINSSTCVWISF